MSTTAFEVTLEFHDVQPSNEPVGETVTFVLAGGVFHRQVTAGGAGESRQSVSVESLASELARLFSMSDLDRAFESLRALQEALAKSG